MASTGARRILALAAALCLLIALSVALGISLMHAEPSWGSSPETCLLCHQGAPGQPGNPLEVYTAVHDSAVGECLTCHTFENESIHGSWTDTPAACARCHRTHSAVEDDLLVMDKTDLCLFCHGTSAGLAQTDVLEGILRTDTGPLRGGGFQQARMNTSSVFEAGYSTSESEWQFPIGSSPLQASTSEHTLGTEATIWGSWNAEGVSAAPNAGDTNTTLECVSCHDPHAYGQTYRMLSRRPADSGVAKHPDETSDPWEQRVFVTDQLAYAERYPTSDILSYTTDDYSNTQIGAKTWDAGNGTWVVDKTPGTSYAAPDVLDPDTGDPLHVTNLYGTTLMYSQQLTEWCASCHDRYHAPQIDHKAPGSTDSGDAIFSYRHKTGDEAPDWSMMALASGAHDGGNATATLTDSGADFVIDGVVIGDIVLNLTDGSEGNVTAVAATTIGGSLIGGTDNLWDIGDQYEVYRSRLMTTSCGYGCHSSRQLNCLGCHVAHGTTAAMTSIIAAMPWPGTDSGHYDTQTGGTRLGEAQLAEDTRPEFTGSTDHDSELRSNLLRLDNRGVCQNPGCHPKGKTDYVEPYDETEDLCERCHATGDPHDNVGPDDCGFCHQGATSGDCATCHAATLTEWSSTGHGKTTGTYPASGNPAADFPGAANGENPCLYCHDDSVAHGTASNPFRLANTNSPQNTNCLTCHEDSSTGYDPDDVAGPMASVNATTAKVNNNHFEYKHGSGNNGGDFCWDCHDPHGDQNVVMIQDRVSKTSTSDFGRPISTVATTFNSVGTWGSYVNDSSFDGICQVCHESTARFTGGTNYDSGHYSSMACTTCHLHDSGFAPGAGDCTACHSSPMGSRSAVDTTAWNASSHEVTDCLGCHDETTSHMDGTVQLSAVGDPDVYVESPVGAIPSLDQFCFECHTDGMVQNDAISGPGLADDIEQAFGFGDANKHNLGTSFAVYGNDYTIQCTTCHNPHVATGKYWEADQDESPVTRPDFSDPVNNPRAMGDALWGAVAGQKMDDFAAQGTGSGGWYDGEARGGVISSDRAAVYVPPKTLGGGWANHEFDGAVLPDYTTLCLDCHTQRMSAANPPVNWGQPGVSPTGNSVDPPDQRIAYNAPHGLGLANRPYAWDPGSTFYGSSGNPDPIFNEPNVQRGRGAGQFMRWPYESADKNAGMNFVLSCTDCHEAHGSPVGSMLRTTVSDGPGSTTWNTMCNNCHYYYGYQHAGMSCGNASCHEANSVHRIVKNGESSGATHLWSAPSRPTTTPEIDTVRGVLGSNELTVTFTQGVWTNLVQTGALEPGDFLLTDVGGDHPKAIGSIAHTPGDATAIITLNSNLIVGDLSDLLATTGVSVWDADGDPAGPWPVTISLGPAPSFVITKVESVVNSDKIWVEFSQGAYANPNGTGNLQTSDFTYTNNKGVASIITDVAHTAGDSTVVITVDQNLTMGTNGDIGNDAISAAVNAVYTASGYHMPESAVTIALADEPWLMVVQGVVGHDKLAVWFSERVYANNNATGALQPTDFVFVDTGAGKWITAVEHAAGSPTATLTLSGGVAGADLGGATLAAAGGSIYDITGIPVPTTAVTEVTLTPGVVSFISSVEGVEGSDKIKVTFESQVWTNDDETGALQPGDFTYSNNGTGASSILGVAHSAGNPTAIITVNTYLLGGDIGGDSLAAVADSIFGPSSGNFPLGTDSVAITAQAAPAIAIVEGTAGYDQLFVSFTQGVYAEGNATGTLQPGDFVYADNGTGAASILSVAHTAGSSTAIITVNAVLLGGDIGGDSLAAASSEIFNSIANPVGTASVAITTNSAPAWGASFSIENVPLNWPSTADDTGLLTATVGNPNVAFPYADNDSFNGDETAITYINVDNMASLMSPRAITIEARVRPTEVDRGVGDNTFNRIFQRQANIMATILNTDYRGDDIPARADKASIEVKFRVASRHSAPHPQWPADPYVGTSVWNHQISSDIDQYPIVNDHWYLIKVVFNSDKADVAGSDGTPVDIFIDDLGTDGSNKTVADGGDENWPGYKNATVAINESSSSRWGALPGDSIQLHYNRQSTIGAASGATHAQGFEGQIDWVTWKPYADYSGVDDSPR